MQCGTGDTLSKITRLALPQAYCRRRLCQWSSTSRPRQLHRMHSDPSPPLEAIDQVLCLSPQCQEPVLLKKLASGNGCWSTEEKVLGRDIDTVSCTISLPACWVSRLHELLTSVNQDQAHWRTAKHGPGGPCQQAKMDYSPTAHPNNQLCLNTAVHVMLDNFRWLATSLTSRPT
jgi:hypothetical protein